MISRTNHGFGLLEFVVSFAVLSVAIAALFYVSSASTRGNRMGLNQATAIALVADKMEELRNTSFSSLASGSDSAPITSGGASGGIYGRSWTVTPTTVAGAAARDITVTVSWTGGGSVAAQSRVVQASPILMNPPALMAAFPRVVVNSWNQSQ